jgi:hypothetical protein
MFTRGVDIVGDEILAEHIKFDEISGNNVHYYKSLSFYSYRKETCLIKVGKSNFP